MPFEVKQNKGCWYHIGPRPLIWRPGSFQAWMQGDINYDTHGALAIAIVVDDHTGDVHVVPAQSIHFGVIPNPEEKTNAPQ